MHHNSGISIRCRAARVHNSRYTYNARARTCRTMAMIDMKESEINSSMLIECVRAAAATAVNRIKHDSTGSHSDSCCTVELEFSPEKRPLRCPMACLCERKKEQKPCGQHQQDRNVARTKKHAILRIHLIHSRNKGVLSDIPRIHASISCLCRALRAVNTVNSAYFNCCALFSLPRISAPMLLSHPVAKCSRFIHLHRKYMRSNRICHHLLFKIPLIDGLHRGCASFSRLPLLVAADAGANGWSRSLER